MFAFAACLLASAGELIASSSATAQDCHQEPMLEARAQQPAEGGSPHQLAVALSAGGAKLGQGGYQLIALSARWQYDRFGAALSMPFYRLQHAGTSAVGPGDLMLHARARLLGDADLGAGLSLGVGLPTGSAADNLGMGHSMLMGGAFASWRLSPVEVFATVMLAKALGAAQAHHHGGASGVGPLVDPMNQFEIAGTVRASVWLNTWLALSAGGLVAVPLEQPGVTRVEAGPGARVSRGPWSFGADVRIGIAGDPFELRALLDAMYAF